jgi:hypothetical protein
MTMGFIRIAFERSNNNKILWYTVRICVGLHRAMGSETVYKLWQRIYFRKKSVRILLAEADCFTKQVDTLTDFVELDRAVHKFFVLFF